MITLVGETLYDATVAFGKGSNLVSKQLNCIHNNALFDATPSETNNIPNPGIKHWWFGRPMDSNFRQNNIYHRIKPPLKHQNDQYLPLADVSHISLELTQQTLIASTNEQRKRPIPKPIENSQSEASPSDETLIKNRRTTTTILDNTMTSPTKGRKRTKQGTTDDTSKRQTTHKPDMDTGSTKKQRTLDWFHHKKHAKGRRENDKIP